MTNTTNTTPTSGAADLPEALRSIQRFEVVDYIDDKHVPAVIPKPPGPWVRYEDHSAALAAGQATAAQATPAYKDSTPEMHVGDSAFESWYSTYNPAHKSDKQRARDAYAAGMGDPLVTAAPAAVAGPGDVVSMQRQAFIRGWDERGMAHQLKGTVETDERMRALMDTYFPRTAAPTTQPAPQQDVSAACGDSFLLLPARPTPDAPANTAGLSWDAYSGAQMLAYGRSCSDAALGVAAPQTSPAAQGDALDAARYRYLRDGDWREHEELESVIRLQLNTLWDAKIDAARAAQEQVHGDDTARKQGGAT